jgi:hypothetical protein
MEGSSALLSDIPQMNPRNVANASIPPGCGEAMVSKHIVLLAGSYSALAPVILTSGSHWAASARRNVANCSGVFDSIS